MWWLKNTPRGYNCPQCSLFTYFIIFWFFLRPVVLIWMMRRSMGRMMRIRMRTMMKPFLCAKELGCKDGHLFFKKYGQPTFFLSEQQFLKNGHFLSNAHFVFFFFGTCCRAKNFELHCFILCTIVNRVWIFSPRCPLFLTGDFLIFLLICHRGPIFVLAIFWCFHFLFFFFLSRPTSLPACKEFPFRWNFVQV